MGFEQQPPGNWGASGAAPPRASGAAAETPVIPEGIGAARLQGQRPSQGAAAGQGQGQGAARTAGGVQLSDLQSILSNMNGNRSWLYDVLIQLKSSDSFQFLSCISQTNQVNKNNQGRRQQFGSGGRRGSKSFNKIWKSKHSPGSLTFCIFSQKIAKIWRFIHKKISLGDFVAKSIGQH